MILNRSVETTTEQKCAPVNLGHVLLHRTFFFDKDRISWNGIPKVVP